MKVVGTRVIVEEDGEVLVYRVKEGVLVQMDISLPDGAVAYQDPRGAENLTEAMVDVFRGILRSYADSVSRGHKNPYWIPTDTDESRTFRQWTVYAHPSTLRAMIDRGLLVQMSGSYNVGPTLLGLQVLDELELAESVTAKLRGGS